MNFKVGDIVFITKDSRFYLDGKTNPFNKSGQIIKINTGGALPIDVKWADNPMEKNNYGEEDLELYQDKKLSDYLDDIKKLSIEKNWFISNPDFIVEHWDNNSLIIRVRLVGLAMDQLERDVSTMDIENWIKEVINFNFKHGKGNVFFNW